MPPRRKEGPRQIESHTRPPPESTLFTSAAGAHSGFSFPQELVDHVVDHLEDDRPSLEACALTSRAFLASSRRYQFSEIELTGTPRSHQTRAQKQTLCEKFHALLTNSPHIALLVKDLHILEGDVPWMTKRSPLPLVLRQLVNVKCISLGEAGQVINWSHLPHRVRESLLTILHSPKIQSITLKSIDELPHPAKLFPVLEGSSLTDIMLMRVNLEDGTQDFADPPPSFPLESLRIAVIGPEHLVVLLDHFNDMLARLRDLLVILAYAEELQPAWAFIERSTGLSDLSVAMYWSGFVGINAQSDGRFPNLQAHSELQSIHFNMNLSDLSMNNYWHDPLTWITDALATVSPTAPLREVNVYVETSFLVPARPFRVTAWSRMDALLTSADFMLIPCQLMIDLTLTECPAGSAKIEVYERIRRGIYEGLPQLCSRKLLVVECRSR